MNTMDESGGASLKLFGQVIPLTLEKHPSPSTSDYVKAAASNPPKETKGFPAGKDHDNGEEGTWNVKASEAEVAGETKIKRPELMAKKPSKILPCPRCSSTNTKFCYYNNYNIKQPRHFCRSCQRYWTAGGVMRNVPVGAGKRKNKSIARNRVKELPEVVESDCHVQPHWVYQYWNQFAGSYPISVSPALAGSPMGTPPLSLGKHWRHENNRPTLDGSCISEKVDEKRLCVVSEGLGFDDAEEVARSSMSAMVEMKSGEDGAISHQDWFCSSLGKMMVAEEEEAVEEKKKKDEVDVVLRANPAARERSRNFRQCL